MIEQPKKKRGKKKAADSILQQMENGFTFNLKPEVLAILKRQGVDPGSDLLTVFATLLQDSRDSSVRVVCDLLEEKEHMESRLQTLAERVQWTKDIVAWIRRKEPEIDSDEAALVFVRNALSWWRENLELSAPDRRYSSD